MLKYTTTLFLLFFHVEKAQLMLNDKENLNLIKFKTVKFKSSMITSFHYRESGAQAGGAGGVGGGPENFSEVLAKGKNSRKSRRKK